MYGIFLPSTVNFSSLATFLNDDFTDFLKCGLYLFMAMFMFTLLIFLNVVYVT